MHKPIFKNTHTVDASGPKRLHVHVFITPMANMIGVFRGAKCQMFVDEVRLCR